MTIKAIKQSPTTINKVHESVYRSCQLLEKVTEMLVRGDSSETILEIIHDVKSSDSIEVKL